MKIEYDREFDAIYIQILDEPVKESEEIVPDVIIDYTADNRVAGLEILNASKKVEILDNLKSLLEAKKPLSLSV